MKQAVYEHVRTAPINFRVECKSPAPCASGLCIDNGQVCKHLRCVGQ